MPIEEEAVSLPFSDVIPLPVDLSTHFDIICSPPPAKTLVHVKDRNVSCNEKKNNLQGASATGSHAEYCHLDIASHK